MTEPPSQDLAVVIGNGLSIAAEPELSMRSLTDAIRARFKETGATGEPPDRVLSRLALRAEPTGDPVNDFESIIGPLDQQRENLDDLSALTQLVAGEVEAVRKACVTVQTFVQALQRLGRGHALSIIAERSIASMDHRAVVSDFMTAVVDLVGDASIVFGNLNYDLLALASLSELYPSQLCDMAYGYKGGKFNIGCPFDPLPGHLLRSHLSDFPQYGGRKIKLVHLHGSLTYLRDPATGHIYKFPVEYLRLGDHWAAWRDGETEWEPQVVLTNQTAKSEEIQREPFALAYDVLREQLRQSDRWLIAGYSFRDECVNEMLRDEFHAHRRTPHVMIVTYGESPSNDDVLEGLGWNPFEDGDPNPEDFLYVHRGGIQTAPDSPAWQSWSGFGWPPLSVSA